MKTRPFYSNTPALPRVPQYNENNNNFMNFDFFFFIRTGNNKIKLMNSRAFAGLNQLQQLLLSGNICIEDNFVDQSKMVLLAQVVDTNCAVEKTESSVVSKIWNYFF